jgi:SAM-dependent methyltransferase
MSPPLLGQIVTLQGEPLKCGRFMRGRQTLLILTLAWLTSLAAWRHAPAAQGNDQEQSEESGARRPDIVYVPTPQEVVNVMLGLADVQETDLLYDLGCGDGRIVVTAAEKYGCKALGVDIDPERVRESRANVKAANLEELVTIEQKDIFELDLSEADVVTLYLLAELNVRLIPQLEKMKPGSRVVSHAFPMAGVEPDTVVTVSHEDSSRSDHKIYLWTLPLNKIPPASSFHSQGHPKQRLSTGRVVIYVSLLLSIAALALAAFFWRLRDRLGMIKIKLTVDRPQTPAERGPSEGVA